MNILRVHTRLFKIKNKTKILIFGISLTGSHATQQAQHTLVIVVIENPEEHQRHRPEYATIKSIADMEVNIADIFITIKKSRDIPPLF